MANPPVSLGSIVANVNMDGNHMLFSTRDVIILGVEHSSLQAASRAAAERVGLELSADPMPEQGFFTRSDHYPFVKRGIPAVALIGGFQSADEGVDGPAIVQSWLTTVYHTPGDDLSQSLAWESGADYARVALQIALQVANDEQPPQWNPGDYFGETFGRR